MRECGLTLIPTWISDYYIHHEVSDEIADPFPNFNCTVKVWEWISNFIPHFMAYDYLPMVGLKLIHVTKEAPVVQGLFMGSIDGMNS